MQCMEIQNRRPNIFELPKEIEFIRKVELRQAFRKNQVWKFNQR